MTSPVVFKASCPGCSTVVEWSAFPLIHRGTELAGAHPTTVPEYVISCKKCDRKGAK